MMWDMHWTNGGRVFDTARHLRVGSVIACSWQLGWQVQIGKLRLSEAILQSS